MCKDVAPDSRGKPAKSVELTAFLFSLCPRISASQVLVVLAGLNSNFFFPVQGDSNLCFLFYPLVRVTTYFYISSQTLTFEVEELAYAVKEVAA